MDVSAREGCGESRAGRRPSVAALGSQLNVMHCAGFSRLGIGAAGGGESMDGDRGVKVDGFEGKWANVAGERGLASKEAIVGSLMEVESGVSEVVKVWSVE